MELVFVLHRIQVCYDILYAACKLYYIKNIHFIHFIKNVFKIFVQFLNLNSSYFLFVELMEVKQEGVKKNYFLSIYPQFSKQLSATKNENDITNYVNASCVDISNL